MSPTPVASPNIILWSDDVATLLGLPNKSQLSQQRLKQEWADVFAGNRILDGMKPVATRYGGHQFGHWAGQLGDGRAILLGDVKSPVSHDSWEVQLKGAGPTPYSRHADGRAVLRSSVREFLCSEAMHYLRVPTTRALACVTTGEGVLRDMFYDGHPAEEPGAITTRVARSFLRFGHFEILAASGELELLKALIRYTLSEFAPQFQMAEHAWDEEQVVAWFGDVCDKTAWLVTEWMRVGFVHGVMNTDNMSILGLTIDYGPYGWLDHYDPTWTPNTTDFQHRRYRFENQPAIAHWNLLKLAEALSTVLGTTTGLESALGTFPEKFKANYRQMRYAKLGFELHGEATDLTAEKQHLIFELDELLVKAEVDFAFFYRKLSKFLKTPAAHALASQYLEEFLTEVFYQPLREVGSGIQNEFRNWLSRYHRHLDHQSGTNLEDVSKAMDLQNPYFLLRNFLVQESLDALAANSDTYLQNLYQALQSPYDEDPSTTPFFKKRPEWAKSRPGCSSLSCSS